MNFPTRLWWLLSIVVTTSLSLEKEPLEVPEPPPTVAGGKYLIYIPDTGYMNEDLYISASTYNTTEDTYINIELTETKNNTVISSTEDYLSSECAKILKLHIPFLLEYNYKVVVTLSGGVQMVDSTQLYLRRGKQERKNHKILIQTDKPIYKPNDKVKFRTFGIGADLLASTSAVNISIIDPKRNVMKQWLNDESKTGVCSHEYELSDKPVMGKWRIVIEQEGEKETQYVDVKEYVLPTFKVTVRAKKNIPSLGYGYLFIDQQPIDVSVTAKYTFGKAVRGKLFLNATIDGRNDGLVLTFERLIIGETRVVFSMKDFTTAAKVIVNRYQRFGNPRRITFKAMVVEALTGKKRYSEPFSINIVNAPIKIDIDTPIIYKRGLPKQVKILINRVDGSPLSSRDREIPLTVTTKHGQGFTYKTEIFIPENGIVLFDLVVPVNKGRVSIKVKFTGFHFATTMYEITEMAYPAEFRNEHKDNLEAILVKERVNIGEDIKVSLNSTAQISYAIITTVSNGEIIDNKCISVANNTIFGVDIPTSERMIPKASIVISAVTTAGELMVDACTVKISVAFANKVKGEFNKVEGLPGTKVDFKIATMPGSTVFVMAVDKNLHLLEEAKYISEDMVYDALIGQGNSNTWRRNVRNIHDILRSVNLDVLSNFMEKYHGRVFTSNRMTASTADMHMAPHMAPMSAESSVSTTRVRKFFPETWIWHDEETDASGELIISKIVPDSITMWQANAFALHPEKGLGIMKNPAEFLSHQVFFIRPELPYSLIRGESFILKVSIFSSLKEDQKVTVTIAKSQDYELGIPENSQTVEVKANSDNAVRFQVTPVVVGDIPILIKASCEQASDSIEKKIIVKPEGYTLYFNKAFLLKVSDETPVDIDFEFEPRPDAVKDSERVEVSLIGDIMGPSIEGLGSLIRIPSGCGEQNMINFAPNIYINNYLEATSKLTDEQFKLIKMYTERGYQNQLQYQRPDGSFSAFGDKDKQGSTWLTAFVLRCFGQAKKSIPEVFIDDNIIAQGVRFLLTKRTKDNMFKEDGRVIHSAMQGGASEGVALTTYVLISLLQNAGPSNNLTMIYYFADNLPINEKDTYSLAMMLYLMALIDDTSKFETIEQLLDAQAINKDGMTYWETEEKHKLRNYYESASTGIELASYVLLAYNQRGYIEKGISVMKWLLDQRNDLGGFSSTQDTILALEALCSFATKVKSPELLDVTINSNDNATTYAFPEIGPLTSTILYKHVLPYDTQKININCVGQTAENASYTYALAQISWQYNIKLGSAENVFEGRVEYRKISNDEMQLNICYRTKEVDLTGMVIIEASLPSGYDLTNKEKLLKIDTISKVEREDSTVILYLNEPFATFTCYTLEASQVYEIQGHLSPLPIKIRLYYKPDLELVIMYQTTGGSE